MLLEASPEYGLWISWSGDGSAVMQFVEDESQMGLHPHIHTPPLQHIKRVKGGGSGATVFSGDLGNSKLVWKHGDHKDMRDVFALAEIEHELLIRSEFAKSQSENLRTRIPRFAGVFISPAAFRVRPNELWDSLRKTIIKWNAAGSGNLEEELASLPRPASHQDLAGWDHRRIKVFEGETDINVLPREIRFFVEPCAKKEGGKVFCDYDHTKELVHLLTQLQAKYVWKLSVAQIAIGGETPRTGSSLLTSGELRGDLLNDLLDEFIGVLRSLQAVTKPEEKEAVQQVRKEVENMPDDMSPADISRQADSFVGSAIVKNWHPEKGRYKVARDLAKGLLGEGDLILRDEELLPAKALGNLLLTLRNSMNSVFVESKESETPLFLYQLHRIWRDILIESTHLKSPAATECVWTCGLTDAGLHNMFFSDGKLWLFDLGKPNRQPLPAFLTKFLMSFFHALGMQDTPDGSTWVNRFQESQTKGMLELTAQTKELLPLAHEAYSIVLDRLVNEMFDGEEAVRELLVKYTILQILSDASFCLQKWQIKGGGAPSYGEGNHNRGLEKWLWRALWDIYVATDVMCTYAPDIYVSSDIMKTCEPYVSSSDLSSMDSN
jgi:hypothetical protein